MCKDKANCVHDRVMGKKAVEALLAGKERRNLCKARMTYLERQAKSFKRWCQDKDISYTEIEAQIVEHLKWVWFHEEGDVWQNLIDMFKDMDIVSDRLEDERKMWHSMEGMYHNNVTRGKNKYWEEVKVRGIGWCQTALAKEQQVIDFLNPIHEKFLDKGRLDKPTWTRLFKARDKVAWLRQERIISRNQWAMLSNWMNRMLGCSKRWDVNDDEDLQARIEELWAKLEEMPVSVSPEDRVQDEALGLLVERQHLLHEAEDQLMWEQWKSAGYHIK